MLTISFCKPLFNPNTSFTNNNFVLPQTHKSPVKIKIYCSSEALILSDERVDKSEIVKTLLKTHGFTETHISKLTKGNPKILSANAPKSIAPKIEFLLSIGIPSTDIPKIVVNNPTLLFRSIENQLIPCHKYLKSVLIDDKNVVKMLKYNSRILLGDIERNIIPNVTLLTEIGVPNSRICMMLVYYSTVVRLPHANFKRAVEEVIKMGFDRNRSAFVQAVQVHCSSTKMTLDRKWEAYRRWGLSDDEILMAFQAFPFCMNLSEEKLTRTMDFLVNKMGWEAVQIARCPSVLFYNLETRIVPRCRVIKVLRSQGILKKDLSAGTILVPPEKQFLERFVSRYKDKIPGILDVYVGQTEIDPLEMGLVSNHVHVIE